MVVGISRFWIAYSAGILLAIPVVVNAQFTPAPTMSGSTYLTGANPVSVGVGDFNGDNIPDLAIANLNGQSVTVLLGNAIGGFTAATGSPFTATVGKNPTSIAVADFNNDGFLDLAIANLNGNNVTVLLGTGTGAFSPASYSPIAVGNRPGFVVAGNFHRAVFTNGKPVQDLAVANEMDNTVTVLLGDGNGGFQSPAGTYDVGKQPISIAAGTLNGNAELAIANQLDGTVTVLLGNSAGVFTAATGSPLPVTTVSPGALQPFPVSVALQDLNGDTIPDLVIADEGANTISVLQGQATGGFTAVTDSPFTAGSEPVSVAISDFNSDGHPDIAVVDYQGGNVTVLLGNGAFGFTAAPGSPYSVGSLPRSVAIGDFNGDGKPDLAVANEGSGNIAVLLNSFNTPVTLSSATGMAPVATGSLVSIYGNNLGGNGAMATTTPLPTSLGGISVIITYSDGSQAFLPLLYAGSTQINAVIPAGATTGSATVTVIAAAGNQFGPVMVTSVAPGLFSANETGTGVAAAQITTIGANGFQTTMGTSQCVGTPPTCIAVPLDVSGGNAVLILYGTGIENATLANTMVMMGANPPLTATYVGPAPGDPGEDQVNVPLPASLAGSGVVRVSVVAAGVPSNSVTVFIQ